MKILSQTDVITNSSDETYIIKTTKTPEEVQEIFDRYMRENHEQEWLHDYEEHFPLPLRDTMFPDCVERVRDGAVRISWDSMCNLENAEGYIKEAFPGESVFCEGADHWGASTEEIEAFIGGPQERTLADHWGPIDTSWMDRILEQMPEGPEKEEAKKHFDELKKDEDSE